MRSAVTTVAAAIALFGAATTSAAPGIDAERLKADTAMLSSDAFEGRLPGTAGAEKAVAYLVAQMKAAGLQPGYRGKWTQNVPLVTLTPDPGTMLVIRGGGRDLVLRQGKDAILWTKLARPEVALDPSEMIFVGYGIVAPDRAWNDYAGLDVRGKVVVILVNDPDWQSNTDDGPFGGRRLTYYGRYTYKFEEAARHGAAAALIIHNTAAAGYPFQVLVNTNAGPKIDIDLPETAAAHARVEGWLSAEAATALFERAGLRLQDMVAAAQKPGFKAVPLTLMATTRIANRIDHSVSQNVVGRLGGARQPMEAFLYSAHWDHLGPCPAIDGHAICNGAIDDASGSAGLLELARSFTRGPRPKRSILFLAFTGEEQGMLGSQYYVARPAVPLSRTLGGINIDVMNLFGPTRDVMILHPGSNTLEPLFVRAALQQGRRLSPEIAPNQGLYYRSDQLSLARAGVPMLFASSGVDYLSPPVDGGLPAYFQNIYHTARDVYDPRWDWAGAIADLNLYWAVGAEVANGTSSPRWLPGVEFHRIPVGNSVAPRGNGR